VPASLGEPSGITFILVTMLVSLVAAASLADPEAYLALVEGFAAFASVVGVCSAVGAWLGLVSFDPAADPRPADVIGRGINYGLVAGMPLAVFFAVLVFEANYDVPLS
jgi:hypothetical protein